MAGEDRGSSVNLKRQQIPRGQRDLTANGPAYAFFQAIRLLRRSVRDSGDGKSAVHERIRVRPALNLAFPAADIEQIDAEEDGYRVTANFLGLYGSSSPLPTYYTEDLIAEAGQDESVSRDFLDIIHHRLYGVLFQCWLKYRLFFQMAEERSELYEERLFCLLGLGARPLRRDIPDARALMRYIGLFTQFPRSALGLTTLLRDALPGVAIGFKPCIARMARIPEPQRLAMGLSGCSLGVDTYVGEEIEDRMGKFRIEIGPLTQAGFLRFTPGQPGHQQVVTLTGLYVTEPFEYEIELILAANQAQTVSLGDPVRSVLGVTSWVFSEPTLGEVRTRFAVNPS